MITTQTSTRMTDDELWAIREVMNEVTGMPCHSGDAEKLVTFLRQAGFSVASRRYVCDRCGGKGWITPGDGE